MTDAHFCNPAALLTVRRWLCVVAGFCAALITSAVTADEPIRVMSFNIRYGTANDGKDAWPLRKDMVLQTINMFAPDLLGTQETQPDQARFMKENLTAFQYVGWARDESKNSEECGLLVRSERFEVVASGQFWLSETPDVKFSKSWDSSLPRVVTWVLLRDRKADNREFCFANTHFDHKGETARQESAKLIRANMKELIPDHPVIVTGDFNTGEGSPSYQSLTSDGGLVDVFRSIHKSPQDSEGTFHGFSGKPGKERIDWILSTAHFVATDTEIVRTNTDGRYPSDHFPVTAILKWKQVAPQ